jgi:hypothetical protein
VRSGPIAPPSADRVFATPKAGGACIVRANGAPPRRGVRAVLVTAVHEARRGRAQLYAACQMIGVSARTIQRWAHQPDELPQGRCHGETDRFQDFDGAGLQTTLARTRNTCVVSRGTRARTTSTMWSCEPVGILGRLDRDVVARWFLVSTEKHDDSARRAARDVEARRFNDRQ